VIGDDGALPLPMEGSLPPDLQGMLFRVGPCTAQHSTSATGPADTDADDASATAADADQAGQLPGPPRGALHAVELRDGRAVWYRTHDSPADAGVFWHAGSLLALPETGLPSRYSRFLDPLEFDGDLRVPIASHVHRAATDGTRVLFAVDDGAQIDPSGTDPVSEPDGIWLRFGEWEAGGGLARAQSIELERATWQHDIGVTAHHIVFIESPTARLVSAEAGPVPFGWVPGAEGWVGVVRRDGDGSGVRWFKLDPCLVTHVLGAYEEPGSDAAGGHDGAIVLYVCRYEAPEPGRAIDLAASVLGRRGIGPSAIGGSLAVLERWRVTDTLERTQLDDRHVEYPRVDAHCDGLPVRHGYAVELAWESDGRGGAPVGLLQFDLARDEARSWDPGPGRRASEPLFVRARDGKADDEGWVLSVVDDAERGASDLCVLDASAFGHRPPEAVIHLPARLPFLSHGEWVPADQYR
jgi:carotenoid cleavage dioxygenase-like enzyme